MSGYATPYGQELLLNVLTGQTTPWASNRTVYVGLAFGADESPNTTLANITEVTTDGNPAGSGNLMRVAVAFGNASTDDPETDPVQISNTAEILTAAPTVDSNGIGYAFLTDTAVGTTVAAPASLTAAAPATGGSFTAGTYYWVVTAVNENGETEGSNEVTATVTANQKVALTWTAPSTSLVDSADHITYNVYRGTSTSAENVLVASGLTTASYTDTGASVVSTGTPYPTVNSAANGHILYVWVLDQIVSVPAGQPIRTAIGGLVIQ